MRQALRNILLLLCATLLAGGCVHETYTPEFLTDGSVRLEIGDRTVFLFDELTCQMTYSPEKFLFRVHDDTMSSYYSLVLSEMPTEEGQEIVAREFTWATRAEVGYKRNIVLEVVKLEDDTIWLWNARESIKMTVRFL